MLLLPMLLQVLPAAGCWATSVCATCCTHFTTSGGQPPAVSGTWGRQRQGRQAMLEL